MVERLSVNRIMKEHEALKNGSTVVFYDKDTYRLVLDFLEAECSNGSTFVYDYGGGYRRWNDGIHASCFVCWCNEEGTLYMQEFDCYV